MSVTQQGSLLSWAHQGALLPNAILTVREERPESPLPGLGDANRLDHSGRVGDMRCMPFHAFRAILLEGKCVIEGRSIWSSVPIIRLRFQRCGRPCLSSGVVTSAPPIRAWRRMASGLSIGRSDPCPAEFGRVFHFQGAGLGKRIDGNLDFGASQVLAEVVNVHG